jgi:hypothetical protein
MNNCLLIFSSRFSYPPVDQCVDCKEMRKLAREQFLIKALIRKISTSAGIEINGAPVVAPDSGYYAPVRESSYYS